MPCATIAPSLFGSLLVMTVWDLISCSSHSSRRHVVSVPHSMNRRREFLLCLPQVVIVCSSFTLPRTSRSELVIIISGSTTWKAANSSRTVDDVIKERIQCSAIRSDREFLCSVHLHLLVINADRVLRPAPNRKERERKRDSRWETDQEGLRILWDPLRHRREIKGTPVGSSSLGCTRCRSWSSWLWSWGRGRLSLSFMFWLITPGLLDSASALIPFTFFIHH